MLVLATTKALFYKRFGLYQLTIAPRRGCVCLRAYPLVAGSSPVRPSRKRPVRGFTGPAAPVSCPLRLHATAVLMQIVFMAYLRPRRAVQSCYVDQNGAIILIRRDITIPFDVNHFRYVRMYNSEWRDTESSSTPSMLVMYRDTPPSPWTWLSSILVPRVDGERVVLFFNRWWDADGYFVGPRDMAALFFQACERAGRRPTILNHFFGSDTWEVRPS